MIGKHFRHFFWVNLAIIFIRPDLKGGINMFNLKQFIITKDITFNRMIDAWLLYKYNSVKHSTYYKYKYIIEKYLYPELKNKTLRQLVLFDFNSFVNKFDYLNKNTQKIIITILKSVLKFAERKYDIDFKIDLIKFSNKTVADLQIFTEKEKQKLINFCYNSNNLKSIGILVCLYTGMRIGELCALKWKNINLEEDTITICKTLQRVYTKNSTYILIDTPKSNSSIRKIPINKKLHNILYALKINNNFQENQYFLTGSSEKFIEPRNYQYTFKKILEKIDLPIYNFHILRHTFATDCININMDVKSLSKILGHSNVNITLNKYVHPSFESTKLYLEKI